MMKKFVEYVFLTLGAAIVAMGLETMLAPNGLVDGGVTALSIMEKAIMGNSNLCCVFGPKYRWSHMYLNKI